MYRIAIIDDERMVIESLKGKINWERHQAVLCGSCNNGKDALEMILKTKPDIVILDMKMPVMEGSELIRCLEEQDYSCEIIVSSAYTEFKYTKIAIQANVVDYLEKPIKANQINEAIEKAISNIKVKRAGYLKDMLDSSSYHIETTVNQYEKKEEKREYGMILLGLSAKKYAGEYVSLSRNTLELLEIEIEEICHSSASAAVTVFYRKGRLHEFIVLFTFYGYSIDKNAIELEYYANRLERKMSVLYQGFLDWSTIFHNTQEIVPVYQQLHKNLLFMNLNHEGVCRTEISWQQMDFFHYLTEEIKKRFFLELKRCNMENILNWIERIIQDCLGKPVLNIADIDFLCRQIMNLVFQGIDNTEISNFQQNMEAIEWNPYDFADVFTVRKRLLDYMEQFVRKILEKYQGSSVQIVYDMKKIMEENYNQPLTLKYFSDLYYFKEDYLSKMFKQEFGVNFIDYLTQLRMKKAEKLLKEKSLTVADVAYLLGYNDPKYFCRIFKKKYGITPSKYGDLKKGENDF